MKSIAPLLLLALFAPPAAPAENPAVKDGMPCVEEVCVGDDALSLVHLPWEPAKAPDTEVSVADGRVPDGYVARLRQLLRGEPGAIRAIAPYWLTRRLDAAGLRALAGIRAVCESVGVSARLQGSYASGDEWRTVVSFESVASEDGMTQRFRVASIHRYAVGEASPARLKAIGARMSAAYRGLPLYASATSAAAGWLVSAGQGPHLRLLAPIGDSGEREANLRKHPDCRASAASAPVVP